MILIGLGEFEQDHAAVRVSAIRLIGQYAVAGDDAVHVHVVVGDEENAVLGEIGVERQPQQALFGVHAAVDPLRQQFGDVQERRLVDLPVLDDVNQPDLLDHE